MHPQGAAFLALWNDVDPARDAEYECWHTFEHVPERVGIEGFLAARRYIARERAVDRYFTLYDVDSLGVFSGAAYADVVDRPTEWSRSMRPSLRNFQRNPCATLMTLGAGVGASVATFRIDVRAGLNATELNAVKSALASLLESSGIASMRLGLTSGDAKFPLENTGDAAAGGAHYVLLVEGIDRGELDAAAPGIVATIERCFNPVEAVAWKSFDLAFAIERADLRHPTTRRQPARPELRRRWHDT